MKEEYYMKKGWILFLANALFLSVIIMSSASLFAAQTITSNQTGSIDGYDYELWKDSGTTSMTLNGGGKFSCSWSNINNALFRIGKKFDSTQTYQQLGNISVDYGCDYQPNGNSYLCVYGWTKSPLVEYYIVESWGSWRPPGSTSKGTITVDGDTYDVYETTRTNQPSIIGTATFQQYWSVRTSKRTSGTISVTQHFNEWANKGMQLGKMYECALTVEGYQSSGSADVYSNTITIGGANNTNTNTNTDTNTDTNTNTNTSSTNNWNWWGWNNNNTNTNTNTDTDTNTNTNTNSANNWNWWGWNNNNTNTNTNTDTDTNTNTNSNSTNNWNWWGWNNNNTNTNTNTDTDTNTNTNSNSTNNWNWWDWKNNNNNGNTNNTTSIGSSGLPVLSGSTNVAKPSGIAGNLQVLNWAGFKSAVSYSFDDANSSQINNYAALNALGVHYTFYLQTGKSEASNNIWAQAVKDGHELGNHTQSHAQTASASDIDAATTFIQQHFGVNPFTMAAPYGNRSYVSPAQSKFLVNRGVASGSLAPNGSSDPFNLPCYLPPTGAQASTMTSVVSSARNAGNWQIFCIHGFSGGSDGAYQPIDISQFTNHVTTIKSFGDVWIDSVVNIAAYWRAQKLLTSITPSYSGSDIVYRWTLPANFPPGHYLRVTVSGGTLKQNNQALNWETHGYYEISLDAGSLTISQ
jgi:peptidoglycan/xylan/chitin deacetylase (PgdA/CDA1 family)